MTDSQSSISHNIIFRSIRVAVRALIGAYALSTALHIAVYLLVGERWIIVEFFNTFAQLLWLPTLILVPLCIIWRERLLTLLFLPALVAFCVIWGDMLLPNAPQSHSQDDTVRLLSYNILAINRQHDAYLAAIDTYDPDIIAIQELDHEHAELFQAQLSDEYPYMALHPNGTVGQGILSRYPILEDQYWRHDFIPSSLGHQRVVLQLDDKTLITLYNVHPSHPGMQPRTLFNPEYRSLEIDALLEQTRREQQPILLLGDFNMPDFSEDYRAIRTQFRDAFRDGGYGLGWTFAYNRRFIPLLRLDYIFYSPAFDIHQTQVLDETFGSDHRPIYTEFSIEGAHPTVN